MWHVGAERNPNSVSSLQEYDHHLDIKVCDGDKFVSKIMHYSPREPCISFIKKSGVIPEELGHGESQLGSFRTQLDT